MTTPPVIKLINNDGVAEYHLEFDSAWEGLDSFVEYLQKHWRAEVSESADNVYSRRWVLRVEGIPVSVYHDSQKGNYFLREDGSPDLTQLDRISEDLLQRMG